MQYTYKKAWALEATTDRLLQAARALCSQEDYKLAEDLLYLVGELRLCTDLIEGGYLEGAVDRWASLLDLNVRFRSKEVDHV